LQSVHDLGVPETRVFGGGRVTALRIYPNPSQKLRKTVMELRPIGAPNEHPQSLSQREPVRVAVLRERDALDVFHRQIRLALRTHPRIIEPPNIRMRERSEDVALAREASLRNSIRRCIKIFGACYTVRRASFPDTTWHSLQ
jgi:hypothetical protein